MIGFLKWYISMSELNASHKHSLKHVYIACRYIMQKYIADDALCTNGVFCRFASTKQILGTWNWSDAMFMTVASVLEIIYKEQ